MASAGSSASSPSQPRPPRVFLLDYHHQVLDLWRRESRTSLRVAHLDAHCDLRGLVVDRRAGHAALVAPRPLRQSNFLAIAAAEGRVARIRWFHDRWGGRRVDTFTVLYAGDLAYWPHRRHRAAFATAPRFRLELRTGDIETFGPLEPGEVLDIDWDVFFLRGKPAAVAERQVRVFLDRPWDPPPDQAYVCHSPHYSSTDRRSCERFAESLAERFGAVTEELPPPSVPPARHGPLDGAPRQAARRIYSFLRNAVVTLQGGRFE